MVKHVRGPEDRQIPDFRIIWDPYLDITVVMTEQKFINFVSDLDRQTKKVTSQVPVAHDKTASHHLATLIDSYILEGFRFSWLDKTGGPQTIIVSLSEELHQQSECVLPHTCQQPKDIISSRLTLLVSEPGTAEPVSCFSFYSLWVRAVAEFVRLDPSCQLLLLRRLPDKWNEGCIRVLELNSR